MPVLKERLKRRTSAVRPYCQGKDRRSGYLLGACYGMTNVRLSAVQRIPLHGLTLFLSMREHCVAAFHPYFRGRADVPLQLICGVRAQLRRRTSTLTRQAVVGARSERDW